MHHAAAENVQNDVVDHDKGADGQAQLLCENDRHDLHAVDRAAVANGQAAAHAGDHAAEQGAQEQVFPRQRRRKAHVHGKHVHDDPRRSRIHGDRKQGIDGKSRPLLFQSEQEKRNVQNQKENGKRKIIRRDLGKEDRRTGNAAVVQPHRG